MKITYTDGIIHIYNDGDDVPWLEQPTYPNGEPWEDEQAAQTWAATAAAYCVDQTNPKPADGPDGR